MEKDLIIPLQNIDEYSESSVMDNDNNFDPFKNVIPQKQNVF